MFNNPGHFITFLDSAMNPIFMRVIFIHLAAKRRADVGISLLEFPSLISFPVKSCLPSPFFVVVPF
jgi:hypothetical protein